MADAATGYEHIIVDDDGAALIAGTTMKVVELVPMQMAYGWSPEELHFQFPQLTLGQIHSALGYYWDHRETVERDIARRAETVEQWRREAAHSPLRRLLRERGSA